MEQISNDLILDMLYEARKKDVSRKMTSREFYKQGIADGISLKKEVAILKENQNLKREDEKRFFSDYISDLIDFIEARKKKLLKSEEYYKELKDEMEAIKEEYPKVSNFINLGEVKELSIDELAKLLKIFNLQNDMHAIELEEIFKAGLIEMANL